MTVMILLTVPLVVAAGLTFTRIGLPPARHRRTQPSRPGPGRMAQPTSVRLAQLEGEARV
ncbi:MULTISPECIES: hypothetical protein [Kitasatospora]|uniref:Uncharacterized protein n=1 Tax=Kitasatospora cystarginea TaxID=58350 RepID=A0ABN3DRN6_9ACTN